MDAMDVDNHNDENLPDVESYAAQYAGRAKVVRMQFFAKKLAGRPGELDALRIAADTLKQSMMDTGAYGAVMEAIAGRLGEAYQFDSAWVNSTEARAAAQLAKLENDLQSYKNNLVKESIRVGHNDLGDFYYSRGDLQNALKGYLRTRDYCTSPRHIISMCLSIIKVAIETQMYSHVQQYAARAKATPGADDDSVLSGKILCAMGLANLDAGKYQEAAQCFIKVSSDLGNQYNDVISAADIATYGGLLALATFNRKQLKREVIDNVSFREYLELVPEVREIVNDFYGSRYTNCLNQFEHLRPQLMLDVHLHKIVKTIYKALVEKCIVQFVAPFTSLSLTHMAEALNTDVNGIEKELKALIGRGEVSARIDSHNKILYATQQDQRAATFSAVINAAEAYIRDAKAQLLRANIMRYDLVQKGPQGAGGPPAPAAPSGWREREGRMDRRHGHGHHWPELAAFGH